MRCNCESNYARTLIGTFTITKSFEAGFAEAIKNAPFYGVMAMIASLIVTFAVSSLTVRIPEEVVQKAFN